MNITIINERSEEETSTNERRAEETGIDEQHEQETRINEEETDMIEEKWHLKHILWRSAIL